MNKKKTAKGNSEKKTREREREDEDAVKHCYIVLAYYFSIFARISLFFFRISLRRNEHDSSDQYC